MLDIALPKVERVASAENYGRFKIEPLEPGYGITLGNALRRILLSSLPGAAVTSIKVDGVFHEFSMMPHIKEDVTELVLNVKKIRLRSFADRPTRLQMRAEGEGVVRAGDIEYPSTIELVNPDLILANLDSEDAVLDMELTVERGRGYSPADQRENLPIGMVPVDAIFTPISKVNYVVEHTRIGQVTDYDRLILEIWTDGTIEPDEALSQAAQILADHSSLIAGFNKASLEQEESQPISQVITPEASVKPIEDLDLSVRTYNCLKRAGITKVGQILSMPEKDLLAIRNFGRKSLDELYERLRAHGYMSAERTPAEVGEDEYSTEEEGLEEADSEDFEEESLVAEEEDEE
ncbi:MAG: DNA-directed RNA polymerase subunit alpha [Chloroflexi bacterium]|nr:DNA-directed RNA polymerase subunit alpha [Chloroflexota bacterium]